MKRGRRHFSTFNVVIVVPAITSVLAFSARWGIAGLIIGAMTLANCVAIYEWLRLPERRVFLNRYFMRIVTAWVGVFLVFIFVVEDPNQTTHYESVLVKTLEGCLAWLAVGWLAGWLAVSLFDSAVETEPQPEAERPLAPAALGKRRRRPLRRTREV